MNELRGETSVTLGGTDYVLRPTFEALQEIERLTGLGLVPLAKKFLAQEFGVSDIRAVLIPAIKAGGAKAPDELGKLIMQAGPINLGGKIASFLTIALSGGEEKNAEAPKDQA